MRLLLLLGLTFAVTLTPQSPPSTGRVAGHVWNSLTGAPVRKATVALRGNPSGGRSINLIADSDAEGQFEFIDLPSGTYRLSAKRAGFLPRPARRVIDLGPAADITSAEIRLPPQGVISGRVLDETNEPEPGALVIVFKQIYRDGRKQWDLLARAIANDLGEYRVPGLKPGRYLVRAEMLRPQPANRHIDPESPDGPSAFYDPVYFPSSSTEREASPVDVGVGAQAGGIDIRLFKTVRPPRVHVTGRVTGLAPDAPAKVSVQLTSMEEIRFGGSFGAAVPPDYAFDLTAVSGQYTLRAHTYSADAFGAANLVVSGNISGLVLPLSPAPRVTGRITIAESGGNTNLQGVTVALEDRPENISAQQVSVDAAGRFAFPKPFWPRHYTMTVRSLPAGCFVHDVKLGGQGVSLDDVELSTSANLEVVLSATAATVTGVVLDADGKPFPNSTVTLIPLDGKSKPQRQPADDEGKVKFAGLRPGKYKLFAWEDVDEDLWQDPDFRRNYESRAADVAVGPSETASVQIQVIAAEEMK